MTARRHYKTTEEHQAYFDGVQDGENEAKQYAGSYVVVFEDHTLPDDRKATASLFLSVRGVVAALPVGETHRAHLEWRELAEALGADPSDDHAQDCALRNARGAAASLREANAIFSAFFKVATQEQVDQVLRLKDEILKEGNERMNPETTDDAAPTDEELAEVWRLDDERDNKALSRLMELGPSLLPRVCRELEARRAGTVPSAEPEATPVERTPEVVLRAMVRAHEATALDAAVRSGLTEDKAEWKRRSAEARRLWGRFEAVFNALVWHLLEEDRFRDDALVKARAYDDYEARLRGDRAIDAPPPQDDDPSTR